MREREDPLLAPPSLVRKEKGKKREREGEIRVQRVGVR